jgi:hypothetical protein
MTDLIQFRKTTAPLWISDNNIFEKEGLLFDKLILTINKALELSKEEQLVFADTLSSKNKLDEHYLGYANHGRSLAELFSRGPNYHNVAIDELLDAHRVTNTSVYFIIPLAVYTICYINDVHLKTSFLAELNKYISSK